VTSAYDRQHGGSEYVERKEVTVHRFPDADASPPRGIGGSGAGSTVDLFFMGKPAPEEHDIVAAQRVIAELRAALEAAQQIAYLPCDWNHCVGECQCRRDAGRPTTYQAAYEQSRATEAELQAKIEEAKRDGLKRGTELAIETLEDQRDKFAVGSEERHYLSQLADGLRVGLVMALAALDATEQPARAEGGQG
jgi:hypothetical protein